MSYEDKLFKSFGVYTRGRQELPKLLGWTRVLEILVEADKEIHDLKTEIALTEANFNSYADDSISEIADLEAQLANSIPKEDMQAMINDIQPYMVNGDLFYESLKSLLSNNSIKGDSDE